MSVRAIGKVRRIYAEINKCYIRLDSNPKPKDGYYWIPLDHPAYNSIFSMAMVAYVNNYNLTIRTKENINPNQHAEIEYVVLEK